MYWLQNHSIKDYTTITKQFAERLEAQKNHKDLFVPFASSFSQQKPISQGGIKSTSGNQDRDITC